MSIGFLTKRADWQDRLIGFLGGCEGRRFAWGRFDCCLFAADAVAAMTGEDPAAGWRGYDSGRGALRMLRERLGSGRFSELIGRMAERLAARAGMAPVGAAYGMGGDVALVSHSGGGYRVRAALGVMDLDGRYVLVPSAAGLARLGRGSVRQAWRPASAVERKIRS